MIGLCNCGNLVHGNYAPVFTRNRRFSTPGVSWYDNTGLLFGGRLGLVSESWRQSYGLSAYRRRRSVQTRRYAGGHERSPRHRADSAGTTPRTEWILQEEQQNLWARFRPNLQRILAFNAGTRHCRWLSVRDRERRKLSFRGLPENTTPETDSQRYLWSKARSM